MAAPRYEISFRVLKKYFPSERSERRKYFSTRIFQHEYCHLCVRKALARIKVTTRKVWNLKSEVATGWHVDCSV